MKKITVEEYDADGKLVKRTITEDPTGWNPYWPYWSVCTCGLTQPCPTHNPRSPWYTTAVTNTTKYDSNSGVYR